MKEWKLETLTNDQVKNLSANLPKEDNKVIVETAGFIPLEVKFKQFEQNGMVNQLLSSDFTSHDYRELYLHPDFDVTPEDDLEEIQDKLNSLHEYQQKYISRLQKQKDNVEIKQADKNNDNKQNPVDSTEKKE